MAGKNYSNTLQSEQLLLLELSGMHYVDLNDVSKKFKKHTRTLLRYIASLKKKGINVIKKSSKGKLYMIEENNQGISSQFTESEFNILMKSFEKMKLDKSFQLRGDLLHKLIKYIYFNTENVGEFEQEITKIKIAIKGKQLLKIQKYYARHGISEDVEVAPVQLDVSRKKIIAYHNGMFKNYNLENMENVENTKEKAINMPEYAPSGKIELDVFGFNKRNNQVFKVELAMTMFATSQLRRQFPLMVKYITPLRDGMYRRLLKIEVHDIEPIARFITGLFNEIKILGSNSAKEKIEEYYFTRVVKGYASNYPSKKNNSAK